MDDKNIYKILIFVLLGFNIVFASQTDSKIEAPYYDYNSSKEYHTSFKSNDSLNFYDFLSGINSVYVITNDAIIEHFDFDQKFYSKYLSIINEYLAGIGIKTVATSTIDYDNLDKNVPLNKTSTFEIKLDVTENYLAKITIEFISCNHDVFQFTQQTDYYLNETWDKHLQTLMKNMFWHQVHFDDDKSYKLNSTITKWDEGSVTAYLNKNTPEPIEGIYEKFGAGNTKYRIAIVKYNDEYEIIYLSGARNKANWFEGELKGIIRKSAIVDFYKVDWVMSDKTINKEVYLSTDEENFLNFQFLDPSISSSSRYLKMLPSFNTEISVSDSFPASSGTGFVINEEGLIVTNYHVIENGNTISVLFDNENFTATYNVDVIKYDKKYDLALLKVVDENFNKFSNTPYSFANTEIDLGEEVFTLGYPLIETMGENVKLSNGIVSGNSGFLGNQNIYQLTVPINPGNSGGPLFNNHGNIIGIISAKHSSASNVAYALKSHHLINFLKEFEIKNTAEDYCESKSLSSLVKKVKEFTCLIKVN